MLFHAGDSDTVAVLEVSRAQMSPLALLRGGASASGSAALALGMVQARCRLLPLVVECVAHAMAVAPGFGRREAVGWQKVSPN